MIVNSVLGEVEIEENQVVRFENGMPGFEGLKAFAMLNPDPELPFTYLQSVEEADVAFLLTDPFTFYPGYEFQLSEQSIEELRIQDVKNVQVWSVMTLKDDIRTATLNLLAPVVINVQASLGRQVILQGTSYTTKHPLAAGTTAAETGA